MKTLVIIIPVSAEEDVCTIQKSVYELSNVDYHEFCVKILYCIDVGKEGVQKYCDIDIPENTEFVFVSDNKIKQAGGYNAGLDRYPNSDYYAFFDIDASPHYSFFHECLKEDADFVGSDKHISNAYTNSITKTISEEIEMYNVVKKNSMKFVKKYFIQACTGLIKGKVFRNFRFTETTAADDELYRYILKNDFTFGYANNTYYTEQCVWTYKELWNQRLRWFMDAWRLLFKRSKSGSYGIAMTVGMIFPSAFILAVPFLYKHIKHIKGYNILWHLILSCAISLIALTKVIKGDKVKWKVSKK